MRRLAAKSGALILLVLFVIWVVISRFSVLVFGLEYLPVFSTWLEAFILTPLIGLLSEPLSLLTLGTGIVTIGVLWRLRPDLFPVSQSLPSDIVRYVSRWRPWDRTVLKGKVKHQGVLWRFEYLESGRIITDERTECPLCGLKLEQGVVPSEEVHGINTSIGEDEIALEAESEAWEDLYSREKSEHKDETTALVCPGCQFSIDRASRPKEGKQGAKSKIRRHIDFMQSENPPNEPFQKYVKLAQERIEDDPKPSDIWDAYTREGDLEDAVPFHPEWSRWDDERTWVGETEEALLTDVGESDSSSNIDRGRYRTFPALEELKSQADWYELFLDWLPDQVSGGLRWFYPIEYLSRKEELMEKRTVNSRHFQSNLRRIELIYGSDVVRALERRADGGKPSFDPERVREELEGAMIATEELSSNVDENFLTLPQRRRLSRLHKEIGQAQEYVRTKVEFDKRSDDLQPSIQQFNDRYERYEGQQRYMTTKDYNLLTNLSMEISQELRDIARELAIEVLPESDAEWISEQKTRFGCLTDNIPGYNQRFVENERDAFSEILSTEDGDLTEQQELAVIRDDVRNLVEASAGTGKTATLIQRFVYLLEKGVSPDDIAALTYNSDAAEKMERRIESNTHLSESEINVYTFHGIALKIYSEACTFDESQTGKARQELVGSYTDAVTADEKAESDIEFKECYQDFKSGYEMFLEVEQDYNDDGYIDSNKYWNESREEFIKRKLRKFIVKAREFDLSPAEIRDRLTGTSQVRDAFGEAGAALVEAYERKIENEDGPSDFDEMLNGAINVIQSETEEFGDRYDHILVDEFQDVTDSILEFVESFMRGGSETHIFCVGDDWQSIYGFRGSDVRHFTEYPNRFDYVTRTTLKVNHRNPPAIANAGKEIMMNSKAPQISKEVITRDDNGEDPVLHVADELFDARVAPYVADLVEATQKRDGFDWNDVMVLSRNDDHSPYMEALREELERREIPHRRPKKEQDYLPKWYIDTLPYPVKYESPDKFVEWNPPDGVEPEEDKPPVVRVQSIHAAKGADARVVILFPANDDTLHGIPTAERYDEILDPAMDITAERIPAERRLFYVAMTRAEEEFHAIAEREKLSRYIEEIPDYFRESEEAFSVELVGRCTWFDKPAEDDKPVKALLDCSGFDVELASWPDRDHPQLEKGSTYKIHLNDPQNQISQNEDYPAQVWFNLTPIEQIQTDEISGDD